MKLPETVTVAGETFRVIQGGNIGPAIARPEPMPEIVGPTDDAPAFLLPAELDEHEAQAALARLMDAVADRRPWTLPNR